MSVTKGLKDENGNIILVQGAGTVYNEEKNSIAIGKDTVASGQDQFVFGRNNVEDAEDVYAEIVGGGFSTVKSTMNVRIEIGDNDVRDFVLEYRGNANYSNDGMGKPLEDDENGYVHRLRYGSNFVYNNGAGGYSNLVKHFFLVKNEVIKSGRKVLAVGVGSLPMSAQEGSYNSVDNGNNTWILEKDDYNTGNAAYSYRKARIRSDIDVIDSKNIRTLDWSGNEHIAGSLAIGDKSIAGTKGQLVFGNRNTEDATKVEIVGGGSFKQELSPEEINADFFKNLAEGSKLKIKIDNAYNSTFYLRLVAHDISEFASKMTKRINGWGKEIHFTFTKGSGVGNVIACFEGAHVTSDVGNIYSFANTYFILTSNLSLGTDQSTDNNPHDPISPYVSMTLSPYTTMGGSVVEVKDIDVSGNIRTLDWQGNQWNKGDVTCDDGNGETVSMRGLAAHKANVYETENIEALEGTVIEKLKAGDIIIKKGTNSNHAYRVSFKNTTGMCLTYADAENVETIAYDKTDDTWAKTDKTVTGITGKAAADHNHDTAYAALNHNHDDAYAAKTHTHNIADVTGLQLALNGKMGNLLSLNMSADTGNSTFPISETESGVLDRYVHGLNADEWHPVCVNMYEDEVASGQAFGFAKVTFGTNSATIVVVIGNKKFSTVSTSFSSDTYTFEAWTKASIGQAFFS